MIDLGKINAVIQELTSAEGAEELNEEQFLWNAFENCGHPKLEGEDAPGVSQWYVISDCYDFSEPGWLLWQTRKDRYFKRDIGWELWERLLIACGKIEPEPDRAARVAELIAGLGDRFSGETAANELAEIGPDAAPAVPELVRVLQSLYQDERHINPSVRALGQIGPAAMPAVPVLTAVLELAHESGDWYVCGDVAEALGRIGAREAAPLIGKLLEPDDPHFKAAQESAAGDASQLRDLLTAHADATKAATTALHRLR